MGKEVTLKQVGYYISGESRLLLWGEGEGTISFSPFKILKEEIETKDIALPIDDGGFGCQYLLEAEVDIYELYENGYKQYIDSRIITKEELDRYNVLNNRDIKWDDVPTDIYKLRA
jgi:hypothetical protein